MRFPVYLFLSLLCAAIPLSAAAQRSESREEYFARKEQERNKLKEKKDRQFDAFAEGKSEKFRQSRDSMHAEFERYRQRLNAEYAVALAKPWKNYKEQPRIEMQRSPKPSVPPAFSKTPAPGKALSPVKVVPSGSIKSSAGLPFASKELYPESPAPKQNKYPVVFSFYDTPCGINSFDAPRLTINKNDNGSVAKAWRSLTDGSRLDPLIADCLRLRDELNLCDWAFLNLVGEVAARIYPGNTDNQAFLATALMAQSGFDVRLARKNAKLALAFHPSDTIYREPYVKLQGKQYYLFGPIANEAGEWYTYPENFHSNPVPINLVIDRYPAFSAGKTASKVFSTADWKEAPPFEISVNPSAIKFLSDYPLVEPHVHARSAVSPELQSTLIPAMKILTKGLSAVEAVNLILRFHAAVFPYMTDGDQFGREKPFAYDENFFYPFNDCEDNAILFTRLVRDVLGLEAVLVRFPGHMTAAVRFPEGVDLKGSTLQVDGRKFVFCEPTCQYPGVGKLASQFANASPTVYKLQ